MNTSTSSPAETVGITKRIEQYRRREISWEDLLAAVRNYPWHAPDLPDAGDWNGWAAGPDTFQIGTWGQVTGAHIDELLTDDEYFALTDAYDAIPSPDGETWPAPRRATS